MSATPAASKRKALHAVLSFVGCMLIGAVVGVVAARSALFETSHLGLSGLEMAGMIVLVVLLLPLLVLWHELGHLAGGRLVGFPPALLVVGPLRWQKLDGRWRMSVNRTAAMAGGLAICVPDGAHDLLRRTAGMIAGGPAASLLGGVAGIALWLALPALSAASPLTMVAAYTAVAAFGFGNLFLALVALFPARTGGFYSDGARLLRMLRGGAEMEREAAILLLTGSSVGGTRARDWPSELVERASGMPDGSLFHAVGLQLAFAQAQDRGEIDAARQRMNQLLESVDVLPPMLRPGVRLACVHFTVIHDEDAARGRELLDAGAGGLLIDQHLRYLAHAVVAWAEGNTSLATAELDRAERALPSAVDRGAAAAAADRIAGMRASLHAGAPGALAPA